MKFFRSSTNKPIKAWVLVDEGHPTLETQCLGLVEAMSFPAQLHRVSLPWIWQTLPLSLIPHFLSKVHSSPKPLLSPWPTFVICGGRTSLKVGIFLRRNFNSFLVSLTPSFSFLCDKLVIESDRIDESKKRIMTLGPLHRIQPDVLLNARQTIYRKIDHLPKPRVGVFLKGDEPLQPLITHLLHLHKKTPFSLMIYCESLSEEAQNQLKSELTKIPHLLWNKQNDNPYLGFLSHSDSLIVSNASSLMVSEATAVGKPMFIYPITSLSSYIQKLIEKGYAFHLQKESVLFPRLPLPPLQETQRVAGILEDAYLKAFPS